MKIFLLDGNCFDYLLINVEDLELIKTAIELKLVQLIGTHVEADEMARTEVSNPEKAKELEKIRTSLNLHKVKASGFVVGINKLNEATLFGWDEIDDFVEMTNDNPKHSEDALLVRTAKREGAILVTEEINRLPRIARERKIEVINTAELAKICASLLN